MAKSVLYYPTIEFTNPEWLWTASILWDRIYRIVPEGYIPNDGNNIRELVESGNFIQNINPKPYASNSSEKFFEFLNDKKRAWACALESARYHNDTYVKMHKNKVDVKLRNMLLAKTKANNDWLDVPNDVATLYMLFLAGDIAESNSLELGTDRSEAWCGSNFFEFDGQIDTHPEENDKTYLCALTINNIVPRNILNLSPQELIRFRNQSRDERIIFFKNIEEFSDSLSKCNDKQVIADIINDHIYSIKKSEEDYKHRCRDIAASNFFGIRTAVTPIVIPVVESIKNLPEDIKVKLELLGVGIGMIGYCFNTLQAITKERRNYRSNYLFQLQKHIPRFISENSDYNDVNVHVEYHNLLNYELEHFIYD
ncbi:MAG: hypothetical protein ACYDG2_22715 [Ruminiclostridium sp.]